MAEKLDKCVSCGAKVPEKQDYPFPGHKADCKLVNGWKKDHEKNESVDPLVAATAQYLSEAPSFSALSKVSDLVDGLAIEDRLEICFSILQRAASQEQNSARKEKIRKIARMVDDLND